MYNKFIKTENVKILDFMGDSSIKEQVLKFKNRHSNYNKELLNKKLEKKGLVGAFMDLYDDFLVFEPHNPEVL